MPGLQTTHVNQHLLQHVTKDTCCVRLQVQPEWGSVMLVNAGLTNTYTA